MQNNTPKTGLAQRMREWMKEQTRPFTRERMCRDMALAEGEEHERASNAVRDFLVRSEIVVHAPQHNARQNNKHLKYKYNHAWKRGDKGKIKPKILKAIYLSGAQFTAADIQRIADAPDMSLVTKTISRLKRSGHIVEVGKNGFWIVCKVIDREKFKIELL